MQCVSVHFSLASHTSFFVFYELVLLCYFTPYLVHKVIAILPKILVIDIWHSLGGESVMRRAFHSEGSFYRQLLYIVEPRQDGKYNQHTNAPWHWWCGKSERYRGGYFVRFPKTLDDIINFYKVYQNFHNDAYSLIEIPLICSQF